MSKNHSSNAIWGSTVSGIKTFTGLFTALFAVRLLGAEEYGQLVAILSLFVLYLGLNTSIFSILVTKIIALDSAEADKQRLLSASLLLTFISIFLLALLTFFVGLFSVEAFAIDDNSQLKIVLCLMLILTILQIFISLFSAMIEAAGRLDLALKGQLLGPLTISLTLLIIYLVFHSLHPYSYLSLLIIGAAIDLLVVRSILRKFYLSGISLSISKETRHQALLLLKSGAKIQAGSLMLVFLEPLNKIFLNKFASPIAVTAYDLSMKLIWGIQSLFTGGMRIFLHQAEEDSTVVTEHYRRVFELVIVPIVLAHTLAGLALGFIIHYWVNVGDYTVIMQFFFLATISNVGMITITPAYVSLISRGSYSFILRSQSVVAFMNIGFSAFLIPRFGLIGAAVGLLLATTYNVFAIYVKHTLILQRSSNLRAVIRFLLLKFIFVCALFAFTIWFCTSQTMQLLPIILITLVVIVMVLREPLFKTILSRYHF